MLRFEINEQMMTVIAEALSNHRYRDAAPVINELQRQVNMQLADRPQANGKAEAGNVQHQPNDN
jgi:hypothetical protein